MYSKYQVFGKKEQNDYNDAVKLLEYGGPKTDSEEDAGEQSPSPPKKTRKRVRAEETPTVPEVTATPQSEPVRTPPPRDVSEASGSRIRTIDPPEHVHLSSNLDEDIIELLRHAASRSAYQTQEYGKLVSYLLEIRKEIDMENADNIIDWLRPLRQSEVKFQLL